MTSFDEISEWEKYHDMSADQKKAEEQKERQRRIDADDRRRRLFNSEDHQFD